MKWLIFLLFPLLMIAQSKEDLLNNLQRGGAIDITDASPTSSYYVLTWDGDEVKIVTVSNLGGAFDALVTNGDITMENGEILSNSVDGDFILTFDDNNATLGQFYVGSSIDSPYVADNDKFEVIFQANDDSSGMTSWAIIETTILDASDESEDSKVSFKTIEAGSSVTPLYLSGNDAVFAGDVTIAGTLEVVGDVTHYGEIYIANNSTEIAVNSQDNWQAVSTLFVEGETNGFTYQTGTSGADIAAYADSGGTHTLVTVTGTHSLSVGDYITIDGTTNYDTLHTVTATGDDSTFVIETVYVADDATGNFARGVSLTCDAGAGGVYRGMWSASGQSADVNQVFKFAPSINATISSKAKSTRKFSNADDGAFGGCGLMNIAAGDKIMFLIYNDTSAGEITIETIDLNIMKM